ncbi:SRPBCC family protein [Granulicella sibirica]|uniref:Polyketide cyclase n=1 Tax=Granulicella sibirica TaxID=2479048 RepID=A0A4Q0T0N3_9BACT|nr:SRPBCC family protein [Granulicella sibirica]RXH55379.1 hypothetical protein GRAN_4483 [Granulicella sibirica]
MENIDTKLTPSDFVVITCNCHIRRPIAGAWQRIGGFDDAGTFLNIACELISDVDGLGGVRKVANSILEVMVGQSEYSYSYAQISGPMAHLTYHGCVSLAADGTDSCRLTYSIVYDQTKLQENERAAQVQRISQRFQGAADAMKLAAENDISSDGIAE